MKEDRAKILPVTPGTGIEQCEARRSGKCLGMMEAMGNVFSDVKYRCYIINFYRNLFFHR